MRRWRRWVVVTWLAGLSTLAASTVVSCSKGPHSTDEAVGRTAQAVGSSSLLGAACTSAATCGARGACDPADHTCICQAPAISCGGACVDVASDGAHCGDCQRVCASGLVCDLGRCVTTAAPRPARRGAVGAACGPASVCAAGSSCVSGACACDAGKTACNGECLDYQTDPNSCGDCGRVCVHASCSVGVCVPMAGPPPPSAFANVVPVAPPAGSTCRHETEAYPTRSLNTGDIFAPYTWSDGGMTMGDVHYNATDGGSAGDAGLTWGTDDTLQEPSVDASYVARADSWSTSDTVYDGGLELFISIPNEEGSGNDSVAVAGASIAQLSSPTSWAFPAQALPDDDAGHKYDGPSGVFDNSAGRFWATAVATDDNHPHVWWTSTPCKVFPASCVMHTATLTAFDTAHHPTIALHPTTVDAMIAFHDNSDEIHMIIVEPHLSGGVSSLVLKSDTTVWSAPYDRNTECADGTNSPKACDFFTGEGDICRCGAISGTDCRADVPHCARIGGRKVHIIGRVASDGTPLALLAWDNSFTDSGTGDTRFQSNLAVYDVTSPTAPSFIAHWVTTPTGGGQTWNSVVGGGNGTDNIGWFHFGHTGDPCSSYFEGHLSTDNGRTSGSFTTGTIKSGIPVVISDRSDGMGDYIGAVRGGLANGDPFATFSEPELTDAGACITCQDASYSLHVVGAELLP